MIKKNPCNVILWSQIYQEQLENIRCTHIGQTENYWITILMFIAPLHNLPHSSSSSRLKFITSSIQRPLMQFPWQPNICPSPEWLYLLFAEIWMGRSYLCFSPQHYYAHASWKNNLRGFFFKWSEVHLTPTTKYVCSPMFERAPRVCRRVSACLHSLKQTLSSTLCAGIAGGSYCHISTVCRSEP